MIHATPAASSPPTGHAMITGNPSPPRYPVSAGSMASTASTFGSKTARYKKNPPIRTARKESVLFRPGAICLRMIMAATIVAAPISRAATMPKPPADHVPGVTGLPIRTAARPPSATNPMMPTLNRPANPHCRFTPRAMMAEINPIFRTVSAVFQP